MIEVTPEVTPGIPLAFVLTRISGLLEKPHTFFFLLVSKCIDTIDMCCAHNFDRALLVCTATFSYFERGFDHKQIIIIFFFCIIEHFQSWSWLDFQFLPPPPLQRLQISSPFWGMFSAARLLQTKPFASDSFEFQPNFILYSCQRPTWSHLRRMPGHVRRAANSPPSTWSRHRPVCKYTAQSQRTLKPHYWLLCKFWVLCWELCVTTALREEQRPWV